MEAKSKILYTSSANNHIKTLIADIERLIANKEDFQAFIVMSIGIEFMGCFLDSFDFNDFGQSKSRFCNALDKLFTPKWYREKKGWMFENLRGSLVHQYRPGREVLLTSESKNGANPLLHLKEEGGKTVFVAEKLLEDLKKAAKKLDTEMNKINCPYNNTKATEKYFNIVAIESWNGSDIPLSGSTENVSVEIIK